MSGVLKISAKANASAIMPTASSTDASKPR